MNEFSYHSIENSSFPKKEHRICMIQVGVSLSALQSDGLPSRIYTSPPYIDKLQKALILALQDHWSNIIVFPEISIPATSLQGLMTLSWDMVNSRSAEAGGCLVCLPLEHISLSQFEELINELTACERFIPGDNSINNTKAYGYLLNEVPPAERSNAFINVAVLLVFGQSESNDKGRYFFQPKRFPYQLERTPKSGRFVPGALTYLLKIGGISFITSVCYDLIAQPPGTGLFLSNLIQEGREKFGSIDYLLLPQCNDAPLDNNFQRAIVDLYHPQMESQTMRVVSPNVAHIKVQNSLIQAGHSWFVTCPFGSELPPLGIWERTLVSVLKDPLTREAVRDAPSIGHYAQRLRLAADGEWLLHLSLPPAEHLSRRRGPNTPLPPHTGKVYGWKDSEWQEKDSVLFERDCRYAERLPGLEVLVELAAWVQENMGGRNTYSPSYAEFTEQRVYLPQDDKIKVLSLLNARYDVWLTGGPASGKTVFGIGIAFDWVSDRKGGCLVFDLKDLQLNEMEFVEQAEGDIEWFGQTVSSPLLVVLDNVHIDDSIAQRLLKHIQNLRGSGQHVQALLLGRYSQKQPTARMTLLDNEFLAPIELKVTEEAFMCVAKRLSQKSGIAPTNNSSQAHKWLRECGSDLVVFSTAFDPLNPEVLDKASISAMVRQRYIVPAEQQGGHQAFLDLCILSSLDLNFEDSSIWGKSAETLFPHFVSDGTVLRVPMRTGNPRAYCRLFHPSLGDLVLRVETHFSSKATQKLCISRALDLCHRQPFLLSLIHQRLASGHYSNVANLNQWCDALNKEDGLMECAVCHSPFPTMLMLRRGELRFSWNRLQKIPNPEGYNVLLESLVRTPAHFIVQFLKYLDDQKLQTERQDLLAALLKDKEFKARLVRTPAHFIVQFLKYLDDQKLQTERQVLLAALLKDKEFKASLVRTPAGDVVTFLKYLDDQKLQTERQVLLAALLKDKEFKASLVRTPAHFIVQFLKYLDDQKLQTERQDLLAALLKDEEFKASLVRTPAGEVVTFFKYLDDQKLQTERQDLLAALLKDEEFAESLFSTPPEAIGCLLVYLGETGNQKLAQEMLDNSWNQLDLALFEYRISHWRATHLQGIQRMIRESGLTLAPELWTALIKKIYGPSYKPVVPDSEYPQDKLFSKSVDELTELLTQLAKTHKRYKLNCIVKSLISDMEELQAWIKSLSPREVALFREAVVKCGIRVSSEAWELLRSPNNNESPNASSRT